VGHIGMYVSSKSQKDLSPLIANWLLERTAETKTKKPAAKTRTKKAK